MMPDALLPESGRAAAPRVVWLVSDGKPGHLNQSLGLAEALARATPVTLHTLPALPAWRALLALLLKRVPGSALPAPDLIVGTGHATHLTLLAARRARGGRAVVLMQPSLPCRWFDLCAIPLHDAPRPAENVFITQGVLNRVRPGAAKDPRQGLILVGGPSRHHRWADREVIEQIAQILARSAPQQRWRLTTSRRTPAGFIAALQRVVDAARLEVVPFERTDAEWLPAQLAWAGTVWVTADSVSMLYEALTAGAAVGLIEVPADSEDRIAGGVQSLVDTGLVTAFSHWRAGAELRAPKQPFSEAARVAREIVQRFFATEAV